MAYLALYREFRPQRFADVVGQQHITRTLRNALVQKRLHHAYLLSGPRGTGKTTVARLLAKAVNCLRPVDGEPCNECSACRSIIDGETMDVIEIDAASNRGIDEIRDLRDKVKYAPADLKYKVYIIDEVHMLSEAAFNALLKTLEEPPRHVLFVLATTEKQKLPVTIISRCQSFEYHRLSSQEILRRLEEVCQKYNLKPQTEALAAIARQAEGGMRDALSLMDQIMAFAVDGQITLEDTLHVLGSAPLDQFIKLDDQLASGDVGGALLLLDELVRQGKDLRQFVRDYMAHLRDLLLLKVDQTGSVLDLPAQSLQAVREQAQRMEQSRVLGGIQLLSQLESDLRFAASPRLLVEVALIRLSGLFSGQVQEAAPVVVAAAPAPAPAAGRPTPAPAVQQPAPSLAAPVSQPVADLDLSTPAPSPAAGPGPAEPSAPPAPSGEGVDQVVAVWEDLMDLIKRHRPSSHTLMLQARIGRLKGNTLVLVARNDALANLLNRPGDKAIIEKALAKLGRPGLEVTAVGPEHPDAKAGPAPNGAPAPGQSEGPSLLDRARKIFPSDLVEEVKEEGS